MHQLTEAQKTRIIKDLKGMSDYEIELYYNGYFEEYIRKGCPVEILFIIKFIESQIKLKEGKEEWKNAM
jgi:hypothetical protein